VRKVKEVRVRAYREDDLPQLTKIWNEARRGSYEFIPYTEEKLKEELEGASCVLVAIGEDDKPLGFSLLRREWYGEEIGLYARPGPEREEVERRLLAAIEEEAEGELVTLVSADDHEKLKFFAAEGYEPESSLYQMIIELSKPWATPQVPGYRLRSLRPDEEELLIKVVNEAYEGERLRPGVLTRWSAEAPPFSPEWVQVAEHEHEGELVAAVVARPDREFNEHFHAKRGYLGPAATLPEHRGKGLNKALTVRALDFLRERGFEVASLYTWSGNSPALKVLKSLGFQISHEWAILRKQAR